MERINPVLSCIIELESALISGESVKSGIHSYINYSDSDELQSQCKVFLLAYENGQNIKHFNKAIKSDLRLSLFHLLHRGLGGEPISQYLKELKTFTIEQSEKDISQFMTVLPFKAMIPLFLFQLPALLILLFGPIVLSLQESFK